MLEVAACRQLDHGSVMAFERRIIAFMNGSTRCAVRHPLPNNARWHVIAIVAGLMGLAGMSSRAVAQERGWRALPGAPIAKRIPVTSTHFGVQRLDAYSWLRAANWREAIKDPGKLPQPIRAYLDAENTYAGRSLAPTRALQKKLVDEMRSRLEPSATTPPQADGPWEYFKRTTTGQEHPLYLRRPRGGGSVQVLLDPNQFARGKPSFEFAGVSHSPDHRYLAYAFDGSGTEDFRIHIRDLSRGRDLPEAIDNSEDTPVWAGDSRSFFYLRRRQGRALEVYRHVIGTPAADDTLVYAETNPALLLTLGRTTSRRFILITAEDSRTTEVRAIDAMDPGQPPRLIVGGVVGERHAVEHQGDNFIILSNAVGATGFVVRAPIAAPGRGNWQELVPHRPGVTVARHVVTARHLIRLEREHGVPRIVVRELGNGSEHTISFGAPPHTLEFDTGLAFESNVLHFTHQNMRQPARTYSHDLRTRQQRLLRKDAIPSGHDPARYVTERVLAKAADGTGVPVSLLYARRTKRDGRAPVWLHGYGAYGTATDPVFDPDVFSLVDRGFIYAIAHVRGGGEMGEAWRADGMLEQKINSFRDFITAGEFLVRQGYTARRRIVASGASAGGLLVAAAVNLRPDLFLGIIAETPFVDALNSMLDAELPLTPTEWNEWGNPITSRSAFETIHGYSPYDNVVRQPYPAMLVLAGLTDPRVTYWEPAKWVARLRAAKTDRNPLIFRSEEFTGHDGPSGRFERLKKVALTYSFALKLAWHRQRESVRPAKAEKTSRMFSDVR